MAHITIKNAPLAASRYPIKAEFTMKPIGVTIHETDNSAPAVNEIAYMQRNDDKVSFHFAVDDVDIIQGVPLDRNTWNSGDGRQGTGNRKTISIEICGNYIKSTGQPTSWYYEARANAEKLTGYLLWKYNWTDKDIYTHNHWIGKNCPRVILRENKLAEFKSNAMKWKAKFAGEDVKEPVAPKPSNKQVTVNGTPYLTSTGGSKGAVLKNFKGEINIEAPGAKYPYHIKGKGWVNAAAIGSQKPNTEIGKGSSVTVNGRVHATAAGAGAGLTLKNHKGKVTHTSLGAKFPYHIDSLGWVAANAVGAQVSKPTLAPKPTPKPTPQPSKPSSYKPGDSVIVNGRVHGTSTGANPGRTLKNHKGKITYTAMKAKYPYHIDQLGWVTAAAVGASTTNNIKVGDRVLVKQGATDYNGTRVTSAWYSTPKVVSELKGNRAVLDAKSWNTAFHTSDLKKV